jgi:hypothetical protein
LLETTTDPVLFFAACSGAVYLTCPDISTSMFRSLHEETTGVP